MQLKTLRSFVLQADSLPSEPPEKPFRQMVISAKRGSEFAIPVLGSVAQSCPALCDPMDCSLPGSSVHGPSPGKHTGVGCHSLLQGIFPAQGSNLGLLHCRQILYHLSHQGSLLRLAIC